MSSQVPPAAPVPAGSQTSNPTAASQAAAASGGEGDTSSISSMADLKEKAPDVHNAMMQGIAMNICRDMEDHQNRMKKILREARQEAGS